MARGTPKRAGRTPMAGAMFPSEVLASNVRKYRQLRELTQEQLGARMAGLGHEWSAGIVGFVERNDRAVSTDELVGLAFSLESTVGELLDPSGPDGRRSEALDIGAPEALPTAWASMWLRGRAADVRVPFDEEGTPGEPWQRLRDDGESAEEYFRMIGGRGPEEDR